MAILVNYLSFDSASQTISTTETKYQISWIVLAKMGNGGMLDRNEPKVPDLLDVYPDLLHFFQQAGWSQFFYQCFDYRDLVAQLFATRFDGSCVEVGGLTFEVTEQTVAEVATLPMDGEREQHKTSRSSVDKAYKGTHFVETTMVIYRGTYSIFQLDN